MEILETRDGFRVSLSQDDTMGNPREEYDGHLAHVVTVPGTRYLPPDKDGGPLAGKWQRVMDTYGPRRYARDDPDPIEIFERYCRTIGVLTLYDTPQDGPNAVWYLMPAQIQEITEWGGDPVKLLEGERDEYRAWAEGSVYAYLVERLKVWHGADHEDDDTMDTWEFVDSVGGFYGWEDAEHEARAALTSAIEEAAK